MNHQAAAARWDAMTVEQRRAAILRDKTMRHPGYRLLVERMANTNFADMSPLQQAAVPELIKGVRW